jgi:PAS domain S-box-containing protein
MTADSEPRDLPALKNGGPHRAAWIAMAYACVAAIWVALSDGMLGLSALEGSTRVGVRILNGLLFVLVTAGLLFLLLRGRAPENSLSPPRKRASWLLGLIFLTATAIISALGYLAYRDEQARLTRAAIADLQSIADLKVAQIENWLDERRGDARVLSLNAGLASAPGHVSGGEKASLIETIRTAYHYKYILLYSRDCRLLGGYEPAAESPPESVRDELCASTRRSGEVRFSDIYAGTQAGGAPRLEFFVPVVSDGGAAAPEILVLGVDLERFLYPLLQSWPGDSGSAESFLVRREGDQVRYLSELRHRPGATLSLTLPLSSDDLPSALALKEAKRPVVDGVDYRGKAVFAAARPVAGTPWVLVAKIDKNEALADVTAMARNFAMILILVVSAVGFAILMLWRDQRRKQLLRDRQQQVDHALLARHYDYLSKYANDAILLTDDAYRILEVNDRATELYGLSRKELIGLPSTELRAPAAKHEFADQLDKVRAGGGFVFETVHKASDGREFPVEISTRSIEIEGVRRFQAIVRDISRRKALERELGEREQLLRLFFDLPFIGMAVTSAETKRWLRYNDRLCEILGYSREELAERSWAELTHPDDLGADVEAFEQVLRGERDGYQMDKRYLRKDGSTVDASIDVKVVRKGDGSAEYFLATVQDISDRKRAERMLRRQKNLYAALSETNQAIIRLRSREAVFGEMCRVAVARAGFLFAWVGLAEAVGGIVRPVARHGDDRGYIDAIRVSTDPGLAAGRGPGGTAIREGVHAVVNDLEADAAMQPWQEAARRAGVGSLAALPLREGGRVIGILSVYAAEPGFFDEAIVALLDEMAQDLGFALDNIERERLRAQAVAELQVAEARWNFALEGAGHGVWEWNVQTNQVFFSHQWKAMLGFADDQIGDDVAEWRSRVHPDDWDMVQQAIRRHLDGQSDVYVSEQRVLAKDGRYRWILDRGKIMTRDPAGKPLLMIGTHTDITPMRAAEQARRDIEERFHRAVEEAPFPIMIHAEDGEVVALSRAWTDLSGYSKDQIPTIAAWTDRAYGEQAPSVRAEIAGLYDLSTRKDEGEYPVVTRGGDHRLWSFSSVALGRMPDGRRIAISMAADITERQRAEQALRESEERFRALVEQSLAGIYIVDNARLIYANPRTAEIFGYTPEEIVDKPVHDLVAPEDRELVRANVARRISGEINSLQYAFRGLRKDGSVVNLGVHGSRAIIKDRPVVIGVMQDITDKLRTEAQIRDYVVRLERSIMGTVDAVSRMVEMRDPYTSGHERRVGQLAAAIAKEMGFSDDSAHGLEITGYVHDIGKITVPAEILSKPGKLSAIEFEMVKTHAEQGYEILKDVDFPWPVAEIVRQHHERLDGSGYPRGLKGDEILLEARILAVADVVESMATHRPYRPSLGIVPALEEIEKNGGRLYDPRVAETCLRLFREKGYNFPA